MEKWIVFYNRETGEEYASYTYQGTFKGEDEATRELIAFEEGITPEVIVTRIESRQGGLNNEPEGPEPRGADDIFST